MSDVTWKDGVRFAVYYAPSFESAWWRAGSTWLGRDAQSGATGVPPQPPGLQRPLTELTGAPRRYGWHGTLVAPFRPAGGGCTLLARRAAGQPCVPPTPRGRSAGATTECEMCMALPRRPA